MLYKKNNSATLQLALSLMHLRGSKDENRAATAIWERFFGYAPPVEGEAQ